MVGTPKAVFEQNNEAIECPAELINEFQFNLKGIATKITIKLFKSLDSDKVYFTQSHNIKTPLQASKYKTSRPYNDNAELALKQALSGLVEYYNDAVNRDHRPSEQWLIPVNEFE